MLIVFSSLAVLLAGCGEAARTDGDSTRTKESAVRVVPKFHLEGTEQLPENLRLHDLGLAVSEIRLTPVNPGGDVAYSNRKPLGLDFRVGEGEIERKGGELVLPDAGKFDVSLRLEPVRSDQKDAKAAPAGRSGKYSFRISGYVSGDGVVRVDPRDGENSDGHPVPFPASPKHEDSESDNQVSDTPALPKQWTPFQYESRKSVVYTLDSVEFVEGKQYLSFSFDAQDWALELVKPLSRAVQSDSGPTEEAQKGQNVVDVTKEIDRLGEGPEALGDHMSVRAVRNGGGRF